MHGRLLVALLALACAALADELCFHDGTYVDGKILSTTASSVTFQPDGGATMTVLASRLDPRSFYHLRNKSLGDDAKGRLALAQFAFDHKMYRQARVQFVRFRKLDPASADAFINLGRSLGR